jgi:hypothetical protein
MNPTPTLKQIEDFSRSTIANLPDSIEQRKSHLVVLVFILPRNSTGRRVAVEMLAALNDQDRAQREFLFNGQIGKDGEAS